MIAGWRFEVLRLAWGSLRANALRGALTVLGIVIGISSVVGMVSLVEGLRASIEAQIDSLGSETITVSRFSSFTASPPDSLRRRKYFTDRDAEELLGSCPSLLGVTASVKARQRLAFRGEQSGQTDVVGVDAHYVTVFSRTLDAGRSFTPAEHRSGVRAAILGADVVEELFAGVDPVGQRVGLGGQRFEVVGVLSERGSLLGQSLDREVLVPRVALERYFGSSRPRIEIAARAAPGRLQRAVEEMTDSLRRTRRLRPAQENDFVLETQESLRNLTRQVAGGVFAVVVAVASVALLVGGIGVMNVMLVSVTERTREIGVRKALGATREQILAQFLAEAVALTGAGGALGILLGVLAGFLIDLATPIPSRVPLWTYLAAFGVSAGVGLFFGSWPAYRASRLDPVAALRHE